MPILSIGKNILAIAESLLTIWPFTDIKIGRHINDDLCKNSKVIEEPILAK
jgi:hypothetical protein